jgi:hypothetical protein
VGEEQQAHRNAQDAGANPGGGGDAEA